MAGDETPRDQRYPRYIAEFVGTWLLVFTVGCNVLSGSPTWAATSIACVLMVSIYALGGVSGANFNPAVSLSLGLAGKIPWSEVGIYTLTQLVAGVTAGFCYSLLLGKTFNLQPGVGFGWWEAGLVEFFYTFMLCFVVLNVATAEKNMGNQFYGLAIGFVIIAGGYAGGNISGGAFNPAVAFGIDFSSLGVGFGWAFLYTGFEYLGAAMAAVCFGWCRPDERGGSPDYNLATRLLSEFLGTFYLVLTVGLNVLGKSPAPVFSIGSALMCMIYALGNCSGAHFNPAVTLAILCSGRSKCSFSDGAAYMLTQITGGIFAACMYCALHHGASFPLEPGVGHSWLAAGIAEVVYTFVLCFVVLSVATVKEPSADMFGLAIGSCVTAGGYAIGAVSGGSLNPAVSFGIATSSVMNQGNFFNAFLYTFTEVIGAGLAAFVFRVTRPSEYSKGLKGTFD